MEGYVLVAVEGCLIAEVVYYPQQGDAIAMAQRLWPDMDHALDDLNVFDLDGNRIWKPPQE